MEPIPAILNEYALQHSSTDDPLLEEVRLHTEKHHTEPHMLSGVLQGHFLSMLSRMLRPKKILEIGTFTGYSALCLAKGLNYDGALHTIEKREDDAALAKSFFDKSEHASRITVHVGNALEVLKNLKEDWDLIFIDADKTGYQAYYDLLIERVKPGTWFLIDNVFFHGEVLKEEIKGKNAKAIHAFNEHIAQDKRVEKVMLTIRDGLTLMYKK